MGSEKEGREIPKIIFDTDVIIWYLRGNRKAFDFIASVHHDDRLISSLCIMELLQGCRNKREVKTIKTFINANFSTVVHPEERIAERALLLLERHALSDGLGTVDALIAASAVTISASLATANNKHFRNIRGLSLVRFEPAEH